MEHTFVCIMAIYNKKVCIHIYDLNKSLFEIRTIKIFVMFNVVSHHETRTAWPLLDLLALNKIYNKYCLHRSSHFTFGAFILKLPTEKQRKKAILTYNLNSKE